MVSTIQEAWREGRFDMFFFCFYFQWLPQTNAEVTRGDLVRGGISEGHILLSPISQRCQPINLVKFYC